MLTFLAILAGCGGDADPAAGPSVGDTLVIAVPAEPANLLPGLATGSADLALLDALTTPLLESGFECSLEHGPGLARSWTWSEDGKVLTMTLRDDVSWSDGQPVTAGDLAFAAQVLSDEAVGASMGPRLADLEPDAPKVVDDHTLEWRFTRGVGDRAAKLASVDIAPLPRHALQGVAPADLRAHPLNTGRPLSSGPWALTSWTRGDSLVLEPNPAFTGPTGHDARLARIVLRVLPDATARVRALERGDVDLVENVPVADLDRIAETHPELRFLRRGWRNLDWIAWNHRDPAAWAAASVTTPPGAEPDPASLAAHPLFGERDVRRALTLAVPVEKLIDELLTSDATGEVYGRPAVGLVSPLHCNAHADALKRLPYDPAASRDALAAAGWTDSDGDGTRDRAGVPLRFTMLLPAGNPRRADAAAILEAAFADVGVDVDLAVLPPEAFFDRVRRHDYDAALFGWSAQLSIDPSSVLAPGGAFNSNGYVNPALPALIRQGLDAKDLPAADAAWRELQRVVYEDQPYTFLYWQDDPVVVHTRFQDFTVDAIGAWRHLWRWSVPPERVKVRP